MSLLLLVLTSVCRAEQLIPLMTYNTPPPLNPEERGNLTEFVATFLTAHSEGKYRFEPQLLPRKRLDMVIAIPKWSGVVIWANPIWFGGERHSPRLWSQPIVDDRNLVLSRKSKPVEYDAPGSLRGLRLGGILGHVYQEFEGMFADGSLTRENALNYLQSLHQLQAGRVDVIFMPASAFEIVMQRNPDMRDEFYVSHQPRNEFHYHAFCSASNPELVAYINRMLPQLQAEMDWPLGRPSSAALN